MKLALLGGFSHTSPGPHYSLKIPTKLCEYPRNFQYIAQEATVQQLQQTCSSAQPLSRHLHLALRGFLVNYLLKSHHHHLVETLHNRKWRSGTRLMIILSNSNGNEWLLFFHACMNSI